MTNNIINMPTPENVRIERYHAAYRRRERGREEYIEGTIELAAWFAEERDRFPANRDFSMWLTERGLDHLGANDRAALSAAVLGYVRAGIPLRVVGVNATPENERLFQGLLGSRPIEPRLQGSSAPRSGLPSSGLPLALVVVSAILLVLLAVNELACARLRWSEAR